MRKVIINRNTWFRGKEDGSALLTEDKKMCCFGFICKQLLHQKNSELDSGILLNPQIKAIFGTTSPKGLSEIYFLNDNKRIPDERREAKLRKAFLKHNIELEFIM